MLYYHDHACLVVLFLQNAHYSQKNAYMMYASPSLVSRSSPPFAGFSASAFAIAPPPPTATMSTPLSSLLLWFLMVVCYFSGYFVPSLCVSDLFLLLFSFNVISNNMALPRPQLDTSRALEVFLFIYLFAVNYFVESFSVYFASPLPDPGLVAFCLSCCYAYSHQVFPVW